MNKNFFKRMMVVGGVLGAMTSSIVATPVFAATTNVVQEINTATRDSFKIVEHRDVDGAENYSGYEIIQTTRGNRITYTLIAEEGTTLGNLENSAGIIDSVTILEDGRTAYEFHYTLFGYEAQRVININVSAK